MNIRKLTEQANQVSELNEITSLNEGVDTFGFKPFKFDKPTFRIGRLEKVSADQLTKAFGKPRMMKGGDGKTTMMWGFTNPQGVVFTVYDYKNPPKSMSEPHMWSVGGVNRGHAFAISRVFKVTNVPGKMVKESDESLLSGYVMREYREAEEGVEIGEASWGGGFETSREAQGKVQAGLKADYKRQQMLMMNAVRDVMMGKATPADFKKRTGQNWKDIGDLTKKKAMRGVKPIKKEEVEEGVETSAVKEGAINTAVQEFMSRIPQPAIKELVPVMKQPGSRERTAKVSKILTKYNFHGMVYSMHATAAVESYWKEFYGHRTESADPMTEAVNIGTSAYQIQRSGSKWEVWRLSYSQGSVRFADGRKGTQLRSDFKTYEDALAYAKKDAGVKESVEEQIQESALATAISTGLASLLIGGFGFVALNFLFDNAFTPSGIRMEYENFVRRWKNKVEGKRLSKDGGQQMAQELRGLIEKLPKERRAYLSGLVTRMQKTLKPNKDGNIDREKAGELARDARERIKRLSGVKESVEEGFAQPTRKELLRSVKWLESLLRDPKKLKASGLDMQDAKDNLKAAKDMLSFGDKYGSKVESVEESEDTVIEGVRFMAGAEKMISSVGGSSLASHFRKMKQQFDRHPVGSVAVLTTEKDSESAEIKVYSQSEFQNMVRGLSKKAEAKVGSKGSWSDGEVLVVGIKESVEEQKVDKMTRLRADNLKARAEMMRRAGKPLNVIADWWKKQDPQLRKIALGEEAMLSLIDEAFADIDLEETTRVTTSLTAKNLKKKPEDIAREIKAEARRLGVAVYGSGNVLTCIKKFTAGDKDAFHAAYRDCSKIRNMVDFTSEYNTWGCDGIGMLSCIKDGIVSLKASGKGAVRVLKAIGG